MQWRRENEGTFFSRVLLEVAKEEKYGRGRASHRQRKVNPSATFFLYLRRCETKAFEKIMHAARHAHSFALSIKVTMLK